MREKINAFKIHVRETSANPDFLHHKWFVKWHLEIVERIALELAEKYPEADRDLVEVMAWLHDYGKTLDYENQYQKTLTAGREKLTELGFPTAFVNRAVDGIELLDKKMELDLHDAPIEVQIVSSADGCSHLVGPFMFIFWNERSDQTFAGKEYEELMQLNLMKANKDWSRKIILPEAREAFEGRYRLVCEQAGQLPHKFLS